MGLNPYEPPAGAVPVAPRAFKALTIWRSVVSVFAGFVVAYAADVLLSAAVFRMFPPPPAIDFEDPEQLKMVLAAMPVQGRITVLVFFGLASLLGAYVAALIARRYRFAHGVAVGGLHIGAGRLIWMLTAIAASLGVGSDARIVIIPSPMWFTMMKVLIALTSAALGAVLAERTLGSAPPRPRPYDMRERNMAC